MLGQPDFSLSMRLPEWAGLHPQAGTQCVGAGKPLRVLRLQPLTPAWSLSPPGTRQRSHRCLWPSSLSAGSGQSSLLQGWDRINARSLPLQVLLQPLAAPGPHHFQLQPPPQGGSHCPWSMCRQECLHSAGREGAPGCGVGSPQLRSESHSGS